MSSYKGHLAGGCVAFACGLVLITDYAQPDMLLAAEWFLATLAGSLFPDIDIKSKGQKYFYWFFLGLIFLFVHKNRIDLLIALSVIAMLPLLVKHRGLFHRLWFVIAFPLGLWWLISLQFPLIKAALFFDTLFFILGAISHLWLDLGLKRMLVRF